MDTALLEILCCPETRQSVRLADAALISRLNAEIASGHLRNQAGRLVTEPLESGLVRADGDRLYPIRQDIPIMLVDEAIPLKKCESV